MRSRGSPIFEQTLFLPILMLAFIPGSASAENVDPAGDGSQYAWGENVGWISAEQDIDDDGNPDQGVHVEDFKVTGWMWGENIGWISLSCLTTESCENVAYTVLNDGTGGLSGRAWAENVGWISFSCSSTDSCAEVDYGVTVDASTGEFAGHAWGENVGWISFNFTDPTIRPYRIKTGWNCDPPPDPPLGGPELFLSKAGDRLWMEWTAPPGATGYDVVIGDLFAMRANGDFESFTDACIASHHPANARGTPLHVNPGEGHFILVRGVNCGGDASYDSFGPSQVGVRDAEIEASGNNCD